MKIQEWDIKNAFKNDPRGSILIRKFRFSPNDKPLIVKTLESVNFQGGLVFCDADLSCSTELFEAALHTADIVIFDFSTISKIPAAPLAKMIGEFSRLTVLRGGKAGGVHLVAAHQGVIGPNLIAQAKHLNIADYRHLDSAVEKAGLELQRALSGNKRRSNAAAIVPAHLWSLPHFQYWYQAQIGAGNKVKKIIPKLNFTVGPDGSLLLYWAVQAHIRVTSERRDKINEIVIGRPDIQHVVAYYRPSQNILNTKLVLVREFRSTAATEDGYIREIPGGSGRKDDDAEIHAAAEFVEETGIEIDPQRLRPIAPRQLAGTTSVHMAHLFAIELTAKEMKRFRSLRAAGNKDETEITYPEVAVLRDLLKHPKTDWANLGMILTALLLDE